MREKKVSADLVRVEYLAMVKVSMGENPVDATAD